MLSDQLIYPLKAKTSPEWALIVVDNFDEFLKDHAGAERKAHANSLSILSKYQNRIEIVETMLQVAADELQHFTEVVGLLHKRGLTLAESLQKDVYVQELLDNMRAESEARMMDRLLTTSVIEARGCERFSLIGEALIKSGQAELGAYYQELARVEARHYGTYLRLAKHYAPKEVVEARFSEILDFEAALVRRLPLRAALH